jgi:hypothetical protein
MTPTTLLTAAASLAGVLLLVLLAGRLMRGARPPGLMVGWLNGPAT